MSSRSMPLHGVSIAVTRAEHRSHSLQSLLAQSGAKVLLLPTIAIHDVFPTPEKVAIMREIRDVPCDLAFTSVEAVRGFHRHLSISYTNTQIPAWNYIFTIGERTEAELANYPFQASHVFRASPSNDVGLAALIRHHGTTSTPIVAPEGSASRQGWTDGLRDDGFQIIRPLVYETRDALPQLDDSVEEIDIVTFFSPSAVHAWHRIYPQIGIGSAAVIGPTTAKACREYGMNVAMMAERPDEESLVKAILGYDDLSRR